MALRLRRARATQRDVAEPETSEKAEPRPEPVVYTGSTILPEEGAAERISSAADVDVNIKRHGVLGGPGGAGGYGGAGTK